MRIQFMKGSKIFSRKLLLLPLLMRKKQKDLEEIRLAKQLFKENIEIKRQKKQDALKTISEKLQQLKEKDKVSEELEESNSNAQMSPQNQKSGLKLTLINEKNKANESLEPTKGPVKPKPKVVYIGRAPNYKPRTKGTDKKNVTPSESKNTDSHGKDEVGKNPNTSSKVDQTAPDFTTLPTDDMIKNGKKIVEPTQSHSKNKIESPKKVKNIPGCQSEAEAKESEKAGCDSVKQTVLSSDMPTDNSVINEAIKNFIRSRKNATPTKIDDNLPGMKTQELPSKIPLPVSIPSPKKSPPFSESSPKVSSPISKSSPKVSSPISKSSPKVSSPLVSSPLVSPPLRKEQSLSEEEKDFLILGISKSDMEPLAVPRPPPSNLIHNPADAVSKFQPFPPPVQIPPPDIISKVPPPNIISQVPPPNITSQVPPPNITSQVPPPTLVLQWSSEQNQQSSSVSNVPLSNNNIPSISEQFSFTSTVNENTGVMDMEIDNDLVCSEIKVGSDVSSAEKEVSLLKKPVINKLTTSSLSAGELCAKNFKQQVLNSNVVIKGDDDRLLLKNFLNSLMDSVSEKVGKDLKDEKNSMESVSENKLLSSNKTAKSDEKSSDRKFSLNPTNFEQSVSFPQSKNNEEKNSVEKIEKDTQRYEHLVTVSQSNADEKKCVNDPLITDITQNVSKQNISKSCQEMEIEKISVNEEEENMNLASISKTTEELHDVKQMKKSVTNSCHSVKAETCEFLEQKNNVSTSEGETSLNDNKQVNENERNLLSLNSNQRETNVNSVMNSSSCGNISSEIADATDEKNSVNDPLIKDVTKDISEENNSKSSEKMEIDQINLNSEHEKLNLTSTSKAIEKCHDAKKIDKPVTNSYHSFETETCEILEQNNTASIPSKDETSTISNTISSGVAVQYDADENICINDPLIKEVTQNISEENNSKCSQEMEIQKNCVNKEEENMNLTSNSKITGEFHDVTEVGEPVTSCHSTEADTCEFLEKKSDVSVSEGETCVNNNIPDNENLNANQKENNVNSSSYDVTISLEKAAQYATDEKNYINDRLIKDATQNMDISEKNNSKSSQEMEIDEINLIMEEENLTPTSSTTGEFHDVKEIEKPVTDICLGFKTETCEFLEQSDNILTPSEDGTSINGNENKKNALSLNINQRESDLNSVMNLSNSTNTTNYDKSVSGVNEKMDLPEDQIAIAKGSPTSSSIIKTEVKEEINESFETFQSENISNRQSAGTKHEINTEIIDDVSSKSTLPEVEKIGQNSPVKSVESPQVQSPNDLTSENVRNMKEDKGAFPSEDSTQHLKNCDSGVIVNKISTDEQPFSNEPEDSTNKPLTEELKGELNSDTDEYETAEN